MKQELQNYVNEMSSSVRESDFEVLNKIGQLILDTQRCGTTIYTAGNGGSAATADHIANDLLKGCRVGENTGFSAISLCSCLPVVTCLANDFSYEDVFAIQLETHGRKGDLFIVFSGSGNSPNILKGVETARRLGMTTIGFTGRDGGKLKELCDLLIIAPTNSMEQIEDMHLIYEHALVSVLQCALAGGGEQVRN